MQSDILPNTQSLKVAIYSPSFWPKVGGLEMVGQLLAEGFTGRGHDVTVITKTECNANIQSEYKVLRRVSLPQIADEIARADILHCNGPSVLLTVLALLKGKPVVWTHQNYRLSCVDGLGWLNATAAPMTPVASALFHLRKRGPLSIKGIILMWLLRLLSSKVNANVAISHHMASRQALPRQSIIYNPFDASFRTDEADARQQLQRAAYKFGFLGRLVSEKGADVLLKALSICNKQRSQSEKFTAVIIGDGPLRDQLKTLSRQLDVEGEVRFTGALTADELRQQIARTAIFILPSVYEEPMGLVALELMSAGKPLVVSATGGLAECADNAAMTFPNGDAEALAQCLLDLSANGQLQEQLLAQGLKRSQEFDPQLAIEGYLQLFASIVPQTAAVKSGSKQ